MVMPPDDDLSSAQSTPAAGFGSDQRTGAARLHERLAEAAGTRYFAFAGLSGLGLPRPANPRPIQPVSSRELVLALLGTVAWVSVLAVIWLCYRYRKRKQARSRIRIVYESRRFPPASKKVAQG